MSDKTSTPPPEAFNPIEDYLKKLRYAKSWIALHRPEKTEIERESLAHLFALDMITIPSLKMYETTTSL